MSCKARVLVAHQASWGARPSAPCIPAFTAVMQVTAVLDMQNPRLRVPECKGTERLPSAPRCPWESRTLSHHPWHSQRPSFSTGMPMRMQLAASGLSGMGSASHLGSCSRMRMSGLERAIVYSWRHRSLSSTSHSSRHSSRGLGARERESHSGNTKWQKDGMANWEHWSDRCVEVPIMVKAAVEETGYP